MVLREHDNAVRWRREDRGGHVESFFLKANDPASDRAFWLKFTILAPVGGREAVGEVWAILFDGHKEQRAAKETFPVEALALGPGGVGITLGECEFGPGRSRGRLRGKDGTVFRWDLRFDGERAPLKPFPYAWMYTAPFPKSKSLTPTSDTRFEGFVEAGELRFEVASWPGMQGHNWGKSHAERYAWAHCNVFADPDGRAVDAVFEGFSARIRLGPVVTPFLTACLLTHGGRTYEFNRPIEWLRASTRVTYTSWSFTARRGQYILVGNLYTPAEQMVGLTYHNPSGGHAHCLNSKIASAELRLTRGDETLLELRSARKAALEVTVLEPEHPVRMVL